MAMDKFILNFDRPANAASGVVRGFYNEAVAKAEVCKAHLPESAYILDVEHLPGSPATQYKPAKPGPEVVRGVRLDMTESELRDALKQIEDYATKRADEIRADNAAEAEYAAERIAVLTTGVADARAVLEPLCKQHPAFKAALEALAKTDAELAERRAYKPMRIGVPSSVASLRKMLTDELTRIEAERAADDARVLDVLRRNGHAV